MPLGLDGFDAFGDEDGGGESTKFITIFLPLFIYYSKSFKCVILFLIHT